MSLDVYLRIETEDNPESPRMAIFIREDGQTREISSEEWDKRFSDREPIAIVSDNSGVVFKRNITHNLRRMAEAAGLSDAVWYPEESGIETASQLIPVLREGLRKLNADPAHFRAFNPANGWGNYEGLVSFISEYLKACEQYPNATVEASR